jgi:hypothetical protein
MSDPATEPTALAQDSDCYFVTHTASRSVANAPLNHVFLLFVNAPLVVPASNSRECRSVRPVRTHKSVLRESSCLLAAGSLAATGSKIRSDRTLSALVVWGAVSSFLS